MVIINVTNRTNIDEPENIVSNCFANKTSFLRLGYKNNIRGDIYSY